MNHFIRGLKSIGDCIVFLALFSIIGGICWGISVSQTKPQYENKIKQLSTFDQARIAQYSQMGWDKK